ncbi:LysE family translocator [Sorangium sp. So ce1182]|uniref:LysE family translocator n=1 Tax=Sorangium sp. So ce1182 TaxID=3133334 RepID=UPI003F6399D0
MFIDPKLFGLFVLTGLALNVTPGPDMMFVIAAGTRGGRRSGVLAALGIGLGGLVHTAAAAAGLSALLLSSTLAFSIVKYAGAAYLLYLGVQALLARAGGTAPPAPAAPSIDAAPPSDRIFWRAVLTSVMNPKVALFFLAFVPQFVSSAHGAIALQFVFLGAAFCTTGTTINVLVGILAGSMRALIERRTGWTRVLDRATGIVFVALGVRLLFVGQK